MNFVRSEMSRKRRMACCNEACVSGLRGDERARLTLVLRIARLVTAEYWNILRACVRNEMQHT
jgi:hypothetical protein